MQEKLEKGTFWKVLTCTYCEKLAYYTRQRKILVHCIFLRAGSNMLTMIMHPPFDSFFLVIVIEGSRHSQMGQKVRFAPSTNSWGGKLHDDVSDLIHMLCTAQWFEKNAEVTFEFFKGG